MLLTYDLQIENCAWKGLCWVFFFFGGGGGGP